MAWHLGSLIEEAAAALVIARPTEAQALSVPPVACIIGYAPATVELKSIFDPRTRPIPRLLDKVGWMLAVELDRAA